MSKPGFSSFERSRTIGLIALAFLVMLIPLIVLGLRRMQHNTAIAACPAVPTARAPAATGSANPITDPSSEGSRPTHHYEYVFPDCEMDVYDMDHNHVLVKRIPLPQTANGTRGVVASPVTHMLYVSYGGDGGSNGNGSLLKYDLLTDTIVWTKSYSTGIDSMAITPDGKTLYMPDGELTPDGIWHVIDASTGNVIGKINAATGPHNTLVSLNGAHVYLGGRNYNYLVVAATATNRVIRRIGPLLSGVRPFTINGKETLAYTTATGFLGFQVSDIHTGQVLYTVPIHGFTWNPATAPSAPSHGISLSPDEKEVYVIDSPNSYVHVFDVSGVPASAPRQIADIQLSTRMLSSVESPCVYDCARDGWVQHSGDGRFVYVGDSGDVIDTITRKVVTTLPPLANTRKMLEIDWRNGVPIFTTSRSGLGYVIDSASITPPPASLRRAGCQEKAAWSAPRSLKENMEVFQRTGTGEGNEWRLEFAPFPLAQGTQRVFLEGGH